MAGKAGLEHGLVGGFAVVELSESPAAGRGVLLRVLDHELKPVLWRPGHERLGTTKDLVVFLRRVVAPGQSGNDGAVRERKLAIPVSGDRYVVAQNGANVVE